MTSTRRPQANATPTRAIVVVNFGSHALVEESLAPIDLEALGARVVIVDNLQSEDEREAISAVCAEHRWTLCAMGSNAGFGHAVNVGVGEAGRLGCITYVILNPDARAGAEELGALFAHAEGNPMVLASPKILRSDGSVWFQGATVDVDAGRTRGTTGPVERDRRAWLTGACLAVHSRLWSAVGGFNPAYFLYWEDVDLSWRVRDAGGDLAVLADVSVVHDVGGTQKRLRGSAAKSPVYVYYNCRNRLLFAALHLDRAQRLRWLAATPRYAWQVLQRGGRRALARRPGPLIWAAVSGSVAGGAYASGARRVR